MKKQFKRTILLLLGAVILFAASMAIPVIHNSEFKAFMQGGAIGFMLAGIISIAIMLMKYFFKENQA